ncbi:AbrB/MazE/SpoVT family DNA-binding domain-containing protein [Paenibacillus elgii]
MKKATGITRRVDNLGRVVLPKELRETFHINEGDALEIFVTSSEIILRKYSPGCTLCGNVDRSLVQLYPDKPVCSGCIKLVADQVEKLQAEARKSLE